MKETEIEITDGDGGATFPIRINPRAGRDRIIGISGGKLKVDIAAAPVKNQANRSLVKLFRKVFKVTQKDVAIIRGLTSREKLIAIQGLDAQAVRDIINGEK